ncbi:hypothetical protein BJ912DRAFT_1019020 [Pholiota molesta]|nr:hypothetical protein BJ912DRAFT_1019020 [Pholiota molesta]
MKPGFCNISRRTKDEDIEKRIRPPVRPLPSKLPPEDEKKVDEVIRTRGFTSKFAREQVSQSDLTRLLPGQWLNDEIINFYGAMLLGRSENCKENPVVVKGKKGRNAPLNIHYFSSFFWAKLAKEGYDKGRLAKWTKKIDVFSKDIILCPLTMKLREYIKAEHQNKKKKDFDFTGWQDWAPDSTPQQENGFDCGVFTCQYMESLSRGEEFFNFSQKDMPYLRRRMIWEIAHAKLRDDH